MDRTRPIAAFLLLLGLGTHPALAEDPASAVGGPSESVALEPAGPDSAAEGLGRLEGAQAADEGAVVLQPEPSRARWVRADERARRGLRAWGILGLTSVGLLIGSAVTGAWPVALLAGPLFLFSVPLMAVASLRSRRALVRLGAHVPAKAGLVALGLSGAGILGLVVTVLSPVNLVVLTGFGLFTGAIGVAEQAKANRRARVELAEQDVRFTGRSRWGLGPVLLDAGTGRPMVGVGLRLGS